VLATIRRQATLVRGAMDGTMLRNEVLQFRRIGTFIERADNTARILDVKYYVLLPSVAWVGSSLDNVQWETVLRSVAGDRAYRWLNAGGWTRAALPNSSSSMAAFRAPCISASTSCGATWPAWPMNTGRKARPTNAARVGRGSTKRIERSSISACTNSSRTSSLRTRGSPRRSSAITGSTHETAIEHTTRYDFSQPVAHGLSACG
jgi:hypothetical protein